MYAEKSSGYTLLEVVIAVTIAVTIAGWSAASLHNKTLILKYESRVVGLWKELQELQSRALKDNCYYFVLPQTATSGYVVYKDKNGNKTPDVGEVENSFQPASDAGNVIFGRPTPTPGSGPNGVSCSNNAVGDWNASGSGMIIIRNDETGSINSGTAYIVNPILTNIGYAIQVLPNSRVIKLYRYMGGSSWLEM